MVKALAASTCASWSECLTTASNPVVRGPGDGARYREVGGCKQCRLQGVGEMIMTVSISFGDKGNDQIEVKVRDASDVASWKHDLKLASKMLWGTDKVNTMDVALAMMAMTWMPLGLITRRTLSPVLVLSAIELVLERLDHRAQMDLASVTFDALRIVLEDIGAGPDELFEMATLTPEQMLRQQTVKFLVAPFDEQLRPLNKVDRGEVGKALVWAKPAQQADVN